MSANSTTGTGNRIDSHALLTKKRSLIRRMFSAIARRYDLLNHLLSLSLDHRWRQAAVRLSGVGAGRRVLDLCCGTGDLAVAFGGRAGSIVGLDFSRPMLSLARRKRATLPLIEGDALLMPFRTGGFDVAAVAFGVRNFPDLSQGIREMARVVGAGGTIIVLELSRPSNPLLGAGHLLYIRLILPVLARAVSWTGVDAYRYLPLSIIGFAAHDRVSEEMRRVGLEDVRTQPLTLGIATVCVGTKPGEGAWGRPDPGS